MMHEQNVEEERTAADRRAREHSNANHDDRGVYADYWVTNGNVKDEEVTSPQMFGRWCCMSREGKQSVEVEGQSGHPFTFMKENNIALRTFTYSKSRDVISKTLLRWN
ncbi:hypothetical protein TNCV_1152351 [Trichonephila clavipes]|nr:hypothetical protein TNCV_1152351 [Trichonephila clavipes]